MKYKLHVTLPETQPARDVLPKVWARKKIEDLSAQLYAADAPEVIEEITNIALNHRLMTQYTSFVAVDENNMQPINQEAKAPRQIVAPVPLPEGTDFRGFYNVRKANFAGSSKRRMARLSAPQTFSAPTAQYSVDRGQAPEALQVTTETEQNKAPGPWEFLEKSLVTPSWKLLASAFSGKVDKDALTMLQKAWEDPMLETVMAGGNQYIAMRSAWCIRTTAQAIPNNRELATLSKQVLSKVSKVKLLASRDNSLYAYLSTLYAVLVQSEEARSAKYKDVVKALLTKMDKDTHIDIKTARLVAEGLVKPSERNDKALQAALATQNIYGDDLVLLTCLLAKNRGGQLRQTFREEFPYIARQRRLNGYVVVIISRIEALQRNIQFSSKP